MTTRKATKAMPKWRPAPEALVRRFTGAMLGVPHAQVRNMFGYPAAFFRGNMFAGLFQDSMFLRLSPEHRAALCAHRGARPFEPMAGRPMREYVVVPPAILGSEDQLQEWLQKARAYAASLPPKARGPRRNKPPSTR